MSAPVTAAEVVRWATLILTLTADDRRELARAAVRVYSRQRYGATQEKDPARRLEILRHWQGIADAFDPEPYGPEDRAAELAAREREAAS